MKFPTPCDHLGFLGQLVECMQSNLRECKDTVEVSRWTKTSGSCSKGLIDLEVGGESSSFAFSKQCTKPQLTEGFANLSGSYVSSLLNLVSTTTSSQAFTSLSIPPPLPRLLARLKRVEFSPPPSPPWMSKSTSELSLRNVAIVNITSTVGAVGALRNLTLRTVYCFI